MAPTPMEQPEHDLDPPLVDAVLAGDAATVRVLLAAGSDPDAYTRRWPYKDPFDFHRGDAPVLVLAAALGFDAVVVALLDAGGDIERPRVYGECCPTSDHESLYRDATALTAASEAGHPEVVKLLLYRGARVDVRDAEERTPLFLAADRGREAVIDILIAAGADLESATKMAQKKLREQHCRRALSALERRR